MPTFTETRNSYIAARNAANLADASAEAILQALTQSVDFGGRYTFHVFVRAGDIGYRLAGPTLDINKVPAAVVAKYITAGQRIDSWRSDGLPDFPDLSDLAG